MSGSSSFKRQPIKLLFTLCCILLGVHVLNLLLEGSLNQFALVPRDPHTLPYILTSPWLHGDWRHLINNLLGFVIFSALILIRGVPFYVKSSFIIIVLTGLLVWLFARPSGHIGASGWIFGLWSLSIAIAWFQKNFVNIVIAIFVAVFYGGMIYGVLPGDPRVSFESHFFGVLSGIAAAYIMTRKRGRKT
ncbi:hypothetical protein TDB9533_04731 [Thalassocella blandensis]|nr:hypothetical protein TDB9533_04731 [Thalassocella blandensis]